MRCFIFFSFLLLAACASNPRAVPGPDGTPHQLISCNWIEDCYRRAAKICGGPYQIVNTTAEHWRMRWQTNSSTDMLVKCGGAQSTPPPPPAASPVPPPTQ